MASSILESAPIQAATKAGLDAATNVMKSPLVRAVLRQKPCFAWPLVVWRTY
jgi:hypothetical protein